MGGYGLPSEANRKAGQRSTPTTTAPPTVANGLATGELGQFGGGGWDPSGGLGIPTGPPPEQLFRRWLADSFGGQFSQPVGQDAAGNDITAGDSLQMDGLGQTGSLTGMLTRITGMSEAQISYLQRRLFQAGFFPAGAYTNSSSISWGIIDHATMQAIQSAVEIAGINQVEDFDQFLENERVRFGQEGTNAEGKDIEGALTARREVNVTLDDPDTIKLIAERAGTTLLGRHPTETEMTKLMEAVWNERRAAARTPSAEDAAIDEAGQDTAALLQDPVNMGGYDPAAGKPGQLDNEQLAVVGSIIQVGTQMGLPEDMIVAAISAGMVESGLRNLNYGDRDSLGVFQQRPSQGWGTPAQIRDVTYAARKFFEAMLRTERKGDLGTWVADTQRPAKQFRDRYGKVMNDAAAILKEYGNIGGGGSGLAGRSIHGRWRNGPAPTPPPAPSSPSLYDRWGPGRLDSRHRPDGGLPANRSIAKRWGLGAHDPIPHDENPANPYWGESLLADSSRDPIYSEQFNVDPEATIEMQLRTMDPNAYQSKQIANRAYEFFALLQAGGMASG